MQGSYGNKRRKSIAISSVSRGQTTYGCPGSLLGNMFALRLYYLPRCMRPNLVAETALQDSLRHEDSGTASARYAKRQDALDCSTHIRVRFGKGSVLLGRCFGHATREAQKRKMNEHRKSVSPNPVAEGRSSRSQESSLIRPARDARLTAQVFDVRSSPVYTPYERK